MAKERLIIEPKQVIIKNPAKDYGQPARGLKTFVGYVRSFERRVRFGKELPIPWWKEYEVKADTAEHANALLAKLAYRDGYALGGVQNIHIKEA